MNVNFEAMEKKIKIILERARDGVEPLEDLEQELLNLHSVSQQRELLNFLKWYDEDLEYNSKQTHEQLILSYTQKFN